MSILKSTKAGKAGMPITIPYLLKNGWHWATKKDPFNANRRITDTSKIECDGRYLSVQCKMVEVEGGWHFEELPVWSYHTHAYDYEFVIRTIGDYEQVANYFKVQKQSKKQRLKEELLKRPDIQITSNLWMSNNNKDKTQPKVLTKHHEGRINEYIASLFTYTEPGTMIWEES